MQNRRGAVAPVAPCGARGSRRAFALPAAARRWPNGATRCSGCLRRSTGSSSGAPQRTSRDTAAAPAPAATRCTPARSLCTGAPRDLYTYNRPVESSELESSGEQNENNQRNGQNNQEKEPKRTLVTRVVCDQWTPRLEKSDDLVDALVLEDVRQTQLVVVEVRAERQVRRLRHTARLSLRHLSLRRLRLELLLLPRVRENQKCMKCQNDNTEQTNESWSHFCLIDSLLKQSLLNTI